MAANIALLLTLLTSASALRMSRVVESPRSSLLQMTETIPGPFTVADFKCQDQKELEFGSPGWHLCMDNWKAHKMSLAAKGKPCVVYDLGVRDDSEFALNTIKDLGCVVRAYDPSPHTDHWWDTGDDAGLMELKAFEKAGKYKLNKQAASQKDGELKLYAYNWDQVSLFRATDETKDKQQEFVVPAKSFSTMMKDNGDASIDIMKIDIEGSEFEFLRGAFKEGSCPPVEHFMFEWHSNKMDFKEGSPPDVKEMEDHLHECGYKKWYIYPFWETKDPANEEKFTVASTFYGLSAYCKNCWKDSNQK